MRTPSTKLNRLIERAEAGGLEVDVIENNPRTDIVESWTVKIRRPHIDDMNGLAAYYNAQLLSIHANRIRGRAVAFKLHATEYGLTEPRVVPPKVLPHTVDSYAGDYRRYFVDEGR